MGKHKITSTFEPKVELDVDDAELLDLERQGLVKSYVSGPNAEKSTDKKGE